MIQAIETYLAQQNSLDPSLERGLSRQGLKRTKILLRALTNPQNSMKVIHVAGSCGKTSTSYFASRLLASLGFAVGLYTSPHITSLREMIQINSLPLPIKTFAGNFNEVRSHIKDVNRKGFGRLTSFEILTALAYYSFAKANVDYAVIETGVGGLYDATNVVTRSDKISVITPISLDHTRMLGNSLSSIAQHKLGIILPKSYVFTGKQNSVIRTVLKETAHRLHAHLSFIKKQKMPHLKLFGEHQVANANLALNVLSYLSKRDRFILNEQKTHSALETTFVPGRFEVIPHRSGPIIFDGAHNPQDFKALVAALRQFAPEQKYHFLVAVRRGNNFRMMLRTILPVTKSVIITKFDTINMALRLHSEDPQDLASFLKGKFHTYVVIENPKQAFDTISKKQGIKVITGSLYLIALFYRRARYRVNA